MKDVVVFNFKGAEARVVTVDGEHWWVAKDVCDVLGLTNPTMAAADLDADEKSTLRITEGGPERVIINEPGLYSLILRSRKPEAKEFKRWVTHEVLPTIRKTGSYSMTRQKSKTVRNLFTDALKRHGYEKQYHYINTTRGMKKALGFESVKKDDMTEKELRKTMATELLAENVIETSSAYGYGQVNPICIETAEAVSNMLGNMTSVKAIEQERSESEVI